MSVLTLGAAVGVTAVGEEIEGYGAYGDLDGRTVVVRRCARPDLPVLTAAYGAWTGVAGVEELLASSAAPLPFVVVSAVPGRCGSPLRNLERDLDAVVSCLAGMHGVTVPAAVPLWSAATRNVSGRLAAIGLPGEAASAAVAESVLTAVDASVLCHGDAGPWNARFEDGILMGLVAPHPVAGPAALDLARAVVSFSAKDLYGLESTIAERAHRAAELAGVDVRVVRAAVRLELLAGIVEYDWHQVSGYRRYYRRAAMSLA